MGLSLSALDHPYYRKESNETLHTERIYIEDVQVGIVFMERPKMYLKDLVENHEFKKNHVIGRLRGTCYIWNL